MIGEQLVHRRVVPVWLVLAMSVILAQDTGVVEGFVGFADAYPPVTKVRISKDQNICGHTQINEKFLVNPKNRGLANAVVYWERPSDKRADRWEEEMVTLSQDRCRFEPHVQVGGSGATLDILNKDGILHNIHAYDSDGETLFNIAQPGFKKSMKRDLKSLSGVVKLRCDVHSWMNGYLLLLDDAVYAITDSSGQYRLDGVDVGQQEIKIWHEGLGEAVRTVQVDSKEPTILDLIIEAND